MSASSIDGRVIDWCDWMWASARMRSRRTAAFEFETDRGLLHALGQCLLDLAVAAAQKPRTSSTMAPYSVWSMRPTQGDCSA